jgi:hypothetical protein
MYSVHPSFAFSLVGGDLDLPLGGDLIRGGDRGGDLLERLPVGEPPLRGEPPRLIPGE